MKILENIYGFLWDSLTANNCNTYLIDGPTRVLIDPGHRHLFDHVANGLKGLGLQPEDIGLVICTHAHPDHVEAVQLFREIGTQLAFHQDEWRLLRGMKKEIHAYFGLDVNTVKPSFLLKEGDLLVNGMQFQVFHTPGHSPGSICLYWAENKTLFTGDLVFKDGLGRTDLPGGDGELLKDSIRRMAEVDAETVLAGHGEIISGRKAVLENFDYLRQEWFACV